MAIFREWIHCFSLLNLTLYNKKFFSPFPYFNIVLHIYEISLLSVIFFSLKTTFFSGSLRAMMTLLPLLGVTWILSLLVPFSVVFHYFFVIFNTLQGMCIFFLHCICNEEVKKFMLVYLLMSHCWNTLSFFTKNSAS